MFPRLAVRTGVISLLLIMGFSAVADTCDLKLWVVEASKENREAPQFDSGLDAIKTSLKALPHDTFKKISADAYHLKSGSPTKIPLIKGYTMEASTPERRGDGRYRTGLRILMITKDTPPKEIEALSTELVLQPDKHLVVRGLKKEDGKELLLVLSISVKKET